MSVGPFPPFDEEAEKIKDLQQVVWSAVGSAGIKRHDNDNSDLDEVLRMAEIYPNVWGAILDDFFAPRESADNKIARHSVKSIRNMQERLHGFPKRKLDLWLVWYTYQLDYNVRDYLELCDVITMWTWEGRDLRHLDENLAKVLEKTPDKRHLAGCYMWNYGERKPLTMDQTKYQLDRYYDWMTQGRIEGIILCSNCIADIGLETVEYTRRWISEVGDEQC